jgi:membrane fusion protein, multidrug efflux system
MGAQNTTAREERELERTAKTKMGARLESGNGAATELQEPRRVKTTGDRKQRIPRWGIFLFVILAAFAVARTLQRGVETAKTTQAPIRPVLVAKVISKDVPLYLDEIGTCAAYETVQVQAQVSGQIIARHFQDGADVKKGDLLFTIDPRPYQAALEQAQAQATLDQITMKRQQELRARNVISPQDLDTAQANTHKSEAAAAAAQVNVDFCYIKSPINGRAGLRLVDVGNIVTGNTGSGAVLLTIQGLDPIYTDFTVAETDLALVRKYLGGPNVKVQTYSPDDKIAPRLGDLYFIDTAVQPGSGTVKARGVTPNPDHAFWPSEFVRVRFILDTIKEARLVPSQAVQISQSGPFIFVLKPDNTVDLRSVKPGQRQDGDLIVVESGVQPDETVVVTGQLALAPGSKVDPKPYGAANPPGGQSAAAKSSL